MRADIDTVDLDAVPIRFKHDNCLYPRADVPLDEYRGNRWRYENECNNLGWRLAWLNREVMSGKRGLLQRAVDSYRNRYRTMRSRRVARLEKMASSSNSSINNGSNSNHGNHGEGNDGTIRKPRKKSTTAMTTTTTTTSSDTKDQQGMKPLINDTTTLNSPTITSSLPLTSVSDIIGTTSLEQLSSHLLIPNTSVEAPSLMNDSLLTQSMASLTAGVLSSDSPMLLANTGTTAMTPTTATESSNIDWSAARSRSARMPKYLVFDAVIKGMSTRVRIRVDPTQKEDVLKHTDDEFRRANALYPRALCPREQYTGMRYDLETRCNQLAFELAALNPARLNGRKALLQKAVDAYRKRFAFDWRPRRGKTALLVRVAAEAAAAVAQQQSPIASKIQLPDTACLSGGSSSSSCNVKEDHSCDTTLPLMSVTPVSTPEPSSLTTVVDVNVMTKTTSTDMTSATIGESTLPGGLDYLQLPTDNAHFESLVLSEVQMLTQKLNSSMSASNVNSVAISPTPSGCLSTNEAQLQALLMDDEHELHDSHNEALLVKQLEEALQRSTQHNQQSHHDSSSGNNSHMSTTVSTPNASNYHQHQHQHHITEHALSAVDLIHALQHQ
ncbi:hypothetical protein BDF22DRAFT_2388 [Syncephalis plumigaleata]|nr:hypothetical protein BDF22DRAFT_2388 [Syncephalis plumigaleata]